MQDQWLSGRALQGKSYHDYKTSGDVDNDDHDDDHNDDDHNDDDYDGGGGGGGGDGDGDGDGDDGHGNDNSDKDIDDNTPQDFLYHLQEHRKSYLRNLIIGSLNINSIRNKFQTIEFILKNGYIDFLALSETKLDESFPGPQFQVPNYDCLRNDRSVHGGGLMFLYSLWYSTSPAFRFRTDDRQPRWFRDYNRRSYVE